MKKLFAILAIAVIVQSAACGVLFYQNSWLQNQKGDLQNQVGQLESQVAEVVTQKGALESQLDELESQNIELQKNVSDLETRSGILLDSNLVVRIIDFIQNDSDTVNVTVQNFGAKPVTDLYVSVSYKSAMSGPSTAEVGILYVGESKMLTCGTGYGLRPTNGQLIAKLVLDGVTLDEEII